MRILVCGGRDFNDRPSAFAALDRIHAKRGIGCIIDGGARGADRLGGEWAAAHGIASEKYPADWNRHGRRAGYIRNQTMLAASRPDLVVAFPGGRGTADMITITIAAGVAVWQPLKPKEIFVFGSNLAGRHGKGAALFARQHHGAIHGQGCGRQGDSYAIPTKDEHLRVLELPVIGTFVDRFIAYAAEHPDLRFQVTAIGTGLAGYRHGQIAPLFAEARALPTVSLPREWSGKPVQTDPPRCPKRRKSSAKE